MPSVSLILIVFVHQVNFMFCMYVGWETMAAFTVPLIYPGTPGGKWSLCVYKVHRHYMRFIYLNHCMGCVPAHLGAGLSQGRKVELLHSQGIGQALGWVGTCSCDGPYSCIIHYFCNKICSKIPRGTIKLNRCTAVCRPALAPAFPRGGKWSFRTLRGLASWWGGPFLKEESGASALMKVGSVWGLAGAHTCTCQLSFNSGGHTISTMLIACLIISHNIISFEMSYHKSSHPHPHPPTLLRASNRLKVPPPPPPCGVSHIPCTRIQGAGHLEATHPIDPEIHCSVIFMLNNASNMVVAWWGCCLLKYQAINWSGASAACPYFESWVN